MICVRRTLIQRREERTECRCPRDAGRTNGSGARWRRVREDVRAKKERLHPCRTKRRDLRELNAGLRRPDEGRMRSVIIIASCNQRNGTSVIAAVRISVNARV